MLTTKPKNKLTRLLPDDEPEEVPQPAMPENGAAVADEAPMAAAAPPQPKWVSALREDVRRMPAEVRVKDITQLRRLLRRAILIEHTTIPPYLCALYSIKDGTNQESMAVIRSVIVEEMLHMILAANVLNAIGGEPSVNHPRFIPSYPSNLIALLNPKMKSGRATLDHILEVDALTASSGQESASPEEDVEVGLLKFSEEAIDVFLRIEQPAARDDDASINETIGAFYKIVIDGLETLEAEAQAHGKTIFTQNPERRKRQISSAHYYNGGGEVQVVTDLRTARKALKEIVFQGEGFDEDFFDKEISIGSYDEIGHYYRFNEIKQGRYYEEGDTPKTGPRGASLIVNWAEVYKMKPNPTLEDYRHNPPLREKGRAFNQAYMSVLDKIQKAFTGEPDALQDAIVFMYDLKYLAAELLKNPLGASGLAAGPIFGYQGTSGSEQS